MKLRPSLSKVRAARAPRRITTAGAAAAPLRRVRGLLTVTGAPPTIIRSVLFAAGARARSSRRDAAEPAPLPLNLSPLRYELLLAIDSTYMLCALLFYWASFNIQSASGEESQARRHLEKSFAISGM